MLKLSFNLYIRVWLWGNLIQNKLECTTFCKHGLYVCLQMLHALFHDASNNIWAFYVLTTRFPLIPYHCSDNTWTPPVYIRVKKRIPSLMRCLSWISHINVALIMFPAAIKPHSTHQCTTAARVRWISLWCSHAEVIHLCESVTTRMALSKTHTSAEAQQSPSISPNITH